METRSGRKRLPKPSEQHEGEEKRIAEITKRVEAHWESSAPYGAPQFDIGRGAEVLLHEVQRYSEALRRIAAKAEEQEALMKHREQTGEELPKRIGKDGLPTLMWRTLRPRL